MLLLQILGMIALTVTGAWLYRAGGSGDLDTKARDVGVPLVMLAAMNLLSLGWAIDHGRVGVFLISLVLCFFLHFGAMTTYWKREVDAKWVNWIFTGLGYSLSMFPYAIISGHWLGFFIRTIILTAFVTVWSELIGRDTHEEWGRGGADIATLPILLI